MDAKTSNDAKTYDGEHLALADEVVAVGAEAEAAEVTLVAKSVMTEMPVAVPEAEIVQQLTALGADQAGLVNATQPQMAVAQGQWFSPAELEVLNAQEMPVAVAYDEVGDVPTQLPSPAHPGTTAVLEPADGAMPVIPNAFSPARVRRDPIKKGIKSTDAEALNSREEIVRFFNFHNTRPLMWLDVEGYHTETYTTSDGNGKTTTRTRHVTDFAYRVDMSSFVYPFGKMVTESSDKTAVEMIDEHLADTNRLKSLQMKKRVLWDQRAIEALAAGYIRQLGWNRGLRVHTRYDDKSVRICTDSKAAKCWDSRCLRCLAVVSVVPALALCLYGRNHRERGLVSYFAVQASPLQVFYAIRSQLWCPMRRGCVVC